MKVKLRGGQAMLEYVIVLLALLAVAAAAGWVVRASRRSAARTAVLVASDSP